MSGDEQDLSQFLSDFECCPTGPSHDSLARDVGSAAGTVGGESQGQSNSPLKDRLLKTTFLSKKWTFPRKLSASGATTVTGTGPSVAKSAASALDADAGTTSPVLLAFQANSSPAVLAEAEPRGSSSVSTSATDSKREIVSKSLREFSRDIMSDFQTVTGTSVQSSMRDMLHNGRMMASGMKAQALGTKSAFVSKIVHSLDIDMTESGFEASTVKPKDDIRRRWCNARRAAHFEHKLEDDPPLLRARSRAKARSASDGSAATPADSPMQQDTSAPLLSLASVASSRPPNTSTTPTTPTTPTNASTSTTMAVPSATSSTCRVLAGAQQEPEGSSSKAAETPVARAVATPLTRGVLEVEVLALTSQAGFRCSDNTSARLPVVQLILGEQITGALHPQNTAPPARKSLASTARSPTASPAASRCRSPAEVSWSVDTPQPAMPPTGIVPDIVMSAPSAGSLLPPSTPRSGTGDPSPSRHRPLSPGSENHDADSGSESAAQQPTKAVSSNLADILRQKGKQTTATARFHVEEVSGVDLRLHVFDVEHHKFHLGLEDRAFCGGALIPLAVLHHRGTVVTGDMGTGLSRCPFVEAEVGVRLLPLEMLDDRKLQTRKDTSKRFRGGLPDLGSVLLRFRLQLHETTLPRLLMQAFPANIRAPSNTAQLEGIRIDDPVSVLTAASLSMTRMSRALNFDLYIGAYSDLRHSVLKRSFAILIWSYTTLLAASWQLPGCFLLGLMVFFWQVADTYEEKARAVPAVFVEEEEEQQSFHERGKDKLRRMVDMEVRLAKFARQLCECAAQLEKVRFVCTLQDPYVSMLYGGTALGLAAAASLFFWMLSWVPFGIGPSLVPFGLGVAALLPNNLQERLRQLVLRAKRVKEKHLGPDRLFPSLLNLWRRVPDGPEAKHWELFRSHVLLPLPKVTG